MKINHFHIGYDDGYLNRKFIQKQHFRSAKEEGKGNTFAKLRSSISKLQSVANINHLFKFNDVQRRSDWIATSVLTRINLNDLIPICK